MSTPEKIVADEKAQLDFSKSMSYGDYLQIDIRPSQCRAP